MEAICTVITSSGKKCKRCVEKHGAEYCWQHIPKSKISPKKTSHKKESPKRMSPKKEDILYLENLPPDVLYLILLKLSWEDLNIICKSSRIINQICSDDIFKRAYSKHHPQTPMFIGNLLPVIKLFNEGTHSRYDRAGNKVDVKIDRNYNIRYVSFTPINQNYGNIEATMYGTLRIAIQKDTPKSRWVGNIQRASYGESEAPYLKEGYMEEIEAFLTYIGKRRWFQGLKLGTHRKKKMILMSNYDMNSFIKIIEKELDIKLKE